MAEKTLTNGSDYGNRYARIGLARPSRNDFFRQSTGAVAQVSRMGCACIICSERVVFVVFARKILLCNGFLATADIQQFIPNWYVGMWSARLSSSIDPGSESDMQSTAETSVP
jgi:hypothetical protein